MTTLPVRDITALAAPPLPEGFRLLWLATGDVAVVWPTGAGLVVSQRSWCDDMGPEENDGHAARSACTGLAQWLGQHGE